MNKINSLIFSQLALFLVFLSGCSSDQKIDTDGVQPIIYETKTLFKSPNDSNTLKTDIILYPNKGIRMSMTAILGISIADIVMTPTQITYMLHGSKQYVTGPFNAKTLFPVFKKNMDPRMLWKVIHDQSPAGPGLICNAEPATKRMISCKDGKDLNITWTYKGYEPFKRIDITANQFEMNWVFKTMKAYEGSQNETMVLKKPSNYKEIIIK